MDLKTYLNANPGSGSRIARALGLESPVIVSQWKSGVKNIPAERCPDIEAATGGVVTCEELRPDVNWAVLRATPTTPAAEAA